MHQPFNSEFELLLEQIKTVSTVTFTTCLLNRYRNGQDSNGWHADDEKELGKNPPIASLSLGASRWFHLKHKDDKTLKQKNTVRTWQFIVNDSLYAALLKHQIPEKQQNLLESVSI